VYVIGELGGMGLIRNAVSQGRQAANHVASAGRRGAGNAYDAVVVGGGPAGMSATLRLMEEGCRVVLLERGDVGGTIMHYPRAKVVMTGARVRDDRHREAAHDEQRGARRAVAVDHREIEDAC
jgi:pyruvate/2-oxoglutarate dehydrogenase complex dihydrolipoamide dehydrogenase (E3) component